MNMDMIYVVDYPWIIDRSEELLDKWLGDHHGAVVLDSQREIKMDATI